MTAPFNKNGAPAFSAIVPAACLVWIISMIFCPVSTAEDKTIRILFLGDSITAGLGVAAEEAYPSLIRTMLHDRNIRNVTITNGSVSGSTTASAVARLKWFLRAPPDILVLALGANDGLRGLSTTDMFRNLEQTILLAKENNIQIILAGMEIPPNYGPEYAVSFKKVFAGLAEHHQIPLIPFLLKTVGGNPSLNQTDGIHPNTEGHKIIAMTVFPFILEQL